MSGTDPARGEHCDAVWGSFPSTCTTGEKSILIFLNTVVAITIYDSIPVLLHGYTTRYLGYQVGTGVLVDANWAFGIRKVKN